MNSYEDDGVGHVTVTVSIVTVSATVTADVGVSAATRLCSSLQLQM